MPSKISYSRARPVRIAFFVDDQDSSSAILDAIFERCFGLWGGRFSLIVPCKHGQPRPAYDTWLATFDPDIIYSYIDLTDEQLRHLHESLFPSFIIKHDRRHFRDSEDPYRFRPDLPIDALKITTVIPLLAAPSFLSPAKRVGLVDTLRHFHDDPFLRDNFGAWTSSVGHSFPDNLSDYGHTVTVVNATEAIPREQYFRPPHETVESIDALLTHIAEKGTRAPSLLSAFSAPRRIYGHTSFSSSFNLVVGDSFEERAFYWNARFLYPKWRDGTFVDLRIPSSRVDDPGFVDSLRRFLNRMNHVSYEGSGGGGSPAVCVRSRSLHLERLDDFAQRLKGDRSWMSFRCARIDSIDDCVPNKNQLTHSHFTVSDQFPISSGWRESEFHSDEIRLVAPTPNHLRFAPPTLLSPFEGTWAVDITLPREIDYTRYSNNSQDWKLPRRLRMVRGFLKGYEIGGQSGAIVMPRVSDAGTLTCYANRPDSIPAIKIPTDESAFAIALVEGRDWWPFLRHREDAPIEQISFGVQRSENGRYFWGTLKLFSSLTSASSILLHKFWLDQFEKLGGFASREGSRLSIVADSLRNRFKKRPIDTEDDQVIETLAGVVLSEAELYRTSIPTRSWYEIARDFRSFREAHWRKSRAADRMSKSEAREWKRHELASLPFQIRELCGLGVLHQGFESRCRTCLHRTWISVAAFDRQIRCEVCGRVELAPVDQPWSFRLNEFLREALRKHGILPLFWTLSKVRQVRETSFFFEGPLNINLGRPDRAANSTDPETDLICVGDGVVRLCEVKTSVRNLGKMDSFCNLAKRMRPDVATLAVMEEDSKQIRTAFDKFSASLEGTGVKPELITFNPGQDFRDDASLYPMESVLVEF